MSEKVFPTSFRALLAKDIREDGPGKISLSGVYVGDDIFLEGESTGKALSSLVILAIFAGGQGEFDFSTKLITPWEEEEEKPRGKVILKKPENVVRASRTELFPVLDFGKFTFRWKLDDHVYEYNFVIGNDLDAIAKWKTDMKALSW